MAANSREQQHREPPLRDRVADDCRQRRHGKGRERAVDPPHGLAHRGRERRGLAGRPRDDPHAAERILTERHVHRRRRIRFEAGVADAADDADDLVEAVACRCRCRCPGRSDRGLGNGDRRTSDRRSRPCGDFSPSRSVNDAAAHERNAQRLEVVRADDAIVGGRPFVRLWRRLALDRERQDVVAAHRQRLRHPGRRDLGKGVEPVEQLVEERDALVIARDRRRSAARRGTRGRARAGSRDRRSSAARSCAAAAPRRRGARSTSRLRRRAARSASTVRSRPSTIVRLP